MSEWRLIETAPKDGTAIWLATPGAMRVGYWLNGEEYEHRGSVGGGWRDWVGTEKRVRADLWFAPTHWMPLPDPPKGTD